MLQDGLHRIAEAISTKPSDLQPPMGGAFVQMAWGSDLGLGGYSTTAAPMYPLLDRKRMVSATGVGR